MSQAHHYPNATDAWLHILTSIIASGQSVHPRGKETLEILHNSVSFNMNYPVVMSEPRKLSYIFMAAEAYWILGGDNTVAGLAPYNKHISQFSDDGITFAGAYGPPIGKQIDYVVTQLTKDNDTRQAVLTIWKPNPGPSKDIPCTVAMTFNIRGNKLNAHVFMRSSDAWLGIPYDFFSFSMVAAAVAFLVNQNNRYTGPKLELGNLHWTGVSSHLYQEHYEAAHEALTYGNSYKDDFVQIGFPDEFLTDVHGYTGLVRSLVACREKSEDSLHPGWLIRPQRKQ